MNKIQYETIKVREYTNRYEDKYIQKIDDYLLNSRIKHISVSYDVENELIDVIATIVHNNYEEKAKLGRYCLRYNEGTLYGKKKKQYKRLVYFQKAIIKLWEEKKIDDFCTSAGLYEMNELPKWLKTIEKEQQPEEILEDKKVTRDKDVPVAIEKIMLHNEDLFIREEKEVVQVVNGDFGTHEELIKITTSVADDLLNEFKAIHIKYGREKAFERLEKLLSDIQEKPRKLVTIPIEDVKVGDRLAARKDDGVVVVKDVMTGYLGVELKNLVFTNQFVSDDNKLGDYIMSFEKNTGKTVEKIVYVEKEKVVEEMKRQQFKKAEVVRTMKKIGDFLKIQDRTQDEIIDMILDIFPNACEIDYREEDKSISFIAGVDYVGAKPSKATMLEIDENFARVEGMEGLMMCIYQEKNKIKMSADVMVTYVDKWGMDYEHDVVIKEFEVVKPQFPEINQKPEIKKEPQKIIKDICALSSGIVGTLVSEVGYDGDLTYTYLDEVINRCVEFINNSETIYECWQDGWNDFVDKVYRLDFEKEIVLSKKEEKQLKKSMDNINDTIENLEWTVVSVLVNIKEENCVGAVIESKFGRLGLEGLYAGADKGNESYILAQRLADYYQVEVIDVKGMDIFEVEDKKIIEQLAGNTSPEVCLTTADKLDLPKLDEEVSPEPTAEDVR